VAAGIAPGGKSWDSGPGALARRSAAWHHRLPHPGGRMPQHIGIVACSAEGAALCYRTICTEAAQALGRHRHPEVSMHTPSLHRYVECLDAGDLDGVAALMLESARKLAASGADFLICPDNTIHQAFARVAARSPLPWLHIADVAAREAARRGFRRVGILGTHWLVGSEVYPERFAAHGLAWERPGEADRVAVGRIIMEELVAGIQHPGQVARLQEVIVRLRARGCDAVVLGCTELPLVLDDGNSPLPTLDSTRLLARAAISRSVGVTP
jgi:aspartate racemase